MIFSLVINNIVQEPGSGKAYTASGTTLTLSAALVNGTDEMYCVFLGRATATNAPSAGSVGASQLASDAVTAAKLNDDIISGQTALASEPADTDEFLVSDAGTLKRIDYSLIKGGGITEYDMFRLTATITSNQDPIQSNLERVDDATFSKIGTGMTLSSGVFSFPSTGLYQVGHFGALQNVANDTVVLAIYATANNGGAWDLVVQSNYANGAVVGSGTANKHTLVNVTDTSNVKIKHVADSIDSGSEIIGNTDFNYTAFYFMRVGDSQ